MFFIDVFRFYLEYHTDTTVRFVVKLASAQFAKFQESGLHKNFRLQETFKLTNMVLFDHNGILRRYKNPEEICEEFFHVRLGMYVKRKEYMVGNLQSQCLKLDNIARFIKEKIENIISVENKKISAVVEMLIERKYDRDPEKVWREEVKKKVKFRNRNEFRIFFLNFLRIKSLLLISIQTMAKINQPTIDKNKMTKKIVTMKMTTMRIRKNKQNQQQQQQQIKSIHLITII